ncbi:glycosyltransferase family 2 protein [Pelomonas sp. SE-A7]|uniref:glycosyltransferase family 2 protein n=1 Tax=Pelomonas sp. SE-A7 TaxID=3054953 RepID=UPI00259D0BCB|nr:glycosyltransferase family 2 protein [Pelomonas sp. SE-A7]MDM4764970.1 glycosyltransferase family 2 protein [Pelomonas sp. SE-A7]
MAADRPFFSILTPTHLRPALLRRSLGSLLGQGFQDFEIIVVADAWDAASAQAAAELLRPQDRFFKRDGKPGPAASRNAALDLARGEWIVFLDDDDSFEPHHLATLHAAIQAGGSPVLFTDCAVVTEDRTQPGMPPLSRQQLAFGAQDVQQLWVKNFIPNHALAYRRSLLEGIRFDAHMASLEDWEFLVAVCERALPRYYPGGGVVMHKDYVNPGTRRGTAENSNNSLVILDFLYTYRRWPAPTPELKAQRQALLTGVGLSLPIEWF